MDKLHKIKTKRPSDVNIKNYKTLCTKYNRDLRKSRREYYQNYFNENRYKSKETWSAIKQIIKKSKKTHSIPSSFMVNDKIVSDRNEIAGEFNSFFSRIGQSVSDDVKKTG